MPKRKSQTRSSSSSTHKQKQTKQDLAWKKACLNQLDKVLEKFSKQAIVAVDAPTFTSVEQIQALKQRYEKEEELGVIVLKNAVSEASMQEAMVNLKKAIVAMWPDQLPLEVMNQLLSKDSDISLMEPYRNTKLGLGNVSFGYWGKQMPAEYVYNTIEGQQVAFDNDYMYAHVNLQLLVHPDNVHTTALLLALSASDSMVSWDSVKEARDPFPKPPDMTEQKYTPPHIDWYNDPELDRRQAIINGDEQSAKLFYVPGSHGSEARFWISQILKKDDLYTKDGYHAITDPDLLRVLYRHSWAPPPFALTLWKPGTIHFEAKAVPQPNEETGLYAFQSTERCPNERRLRFVVGTQKPVGLSHHSRKQIALLAENGLTPAAYAEVNKETIVYRNTVRRRKTLWRKKRIVSDMELWNMKKVATMVQEMAEFTSAIQSAFEKQVPNYLKRRLYGLPQHPVTLDLPIADRQLLYACRV